MRSRTCADLRFLKPRWPPTDVLPEASRKRTHLPLSARCHAHSGFRPHHREAPTQAGDGCGELCAVDRVDRFAVAFLTIDPPDVWRTRAGARCGPCL